MGSTNPMVVPPLKEQNYFLKKAIKKQNDGSHNVSNEYTSVLCAQKMTIVQPNEMHRYSHWIKKNACIFPRSHHSVAKKDVLDLHMFSPIKKKCPFNE